MWRMRFYTGRGKSSEQRRYLEVFLVDGCVGVFVQTKHFGVVVGVVEGQFSEVAGLDVVDEGVELDVAACVGLDVGGVFLDGVDGVEDVELHKTLAAVVDVVDGLQLVEVLGPHVSDGAQPLVEGAAGLLVGEGGPDASAVRVAAHNHLAHLEHLDGELDGGHGRHVRVVDHVGDVSEREHFAGQTPERRALVDSRVAAADPERVRLLALSGERHHRRVLRLQLVHVASVRGKVVLEGGVFRERERVAVAVCVAERGARHCCCCGGGGGRGRRRGCGFVHGHHLDTRENLVGGESGVCVLQGGQEAVQENGGGCAAALLAFWMLLYAVLLVHLHLHLHASTPTPLSQERAPAGLYAAAAFCACLLLCWAPPPPRL